MKIRNKSDSRKMYRVEKKKKQALQRIILFVEIFANVQRSTFLDLYQGV